jgi:hypothetical protein
MMQPIPGYPDYFADRQGNIYSMKHIGRGGGAPNKPHRLKGTRMKYGYLSVEMVLDGKRSRRIVSNLICMTFHGPRPLGLVCCHGPQGPRNDSASNLSWDTMKKNMGEDRRRDGTMRTKLSVDDVKAIRLTDGKMTRREVGKLFGITPEQVGHIVHRQQWEWVHD